MSDSAKPNPFSRRLDIRHMLSTRPPPLDHVLPNLLAGTVGMLTGAGGVGKTMFELQVALGLACGGRICGGLFENGEPETLAWRKPGRVVLVTAEESVDVIWHRLHAIVVTLFENAHLMGVEATGDELMDLWVQNLHLYPLDGMARVMLVDRELETTESLRQLSGACEGARLVILDPIRQFHMGDENDSGSMNAVVQACKQIAARTNAAVVFAHHVNRASVQMGHGNTAGAARGSTALTDGVRWQRNLSEPTREDARARGIDMEERRRFVLFGDAKANYGPKQASEMLERLPGGVLMLADSSRTPVVAVKPGVSKRKLRPRQMAFDA